MTEAPDRLAVVRFVAGGRQFAVEAAHVRAMIPESGPGESAISAECLIGLPPGPPARRVRLVIAADSRQVEVSEPVELASLPADSLFALPALVAKRMTLAGVRAVALTPSGAVLLVEFPAGAP